MLQNALVVTDLDGTLLNTDRRISRENRAALEDLPRRGVIRVAATGRSLYSVRRVLTRDDPFDYVVFSSGAGIMDWRSQRLIHACALQASAVEAAVSVLTSEALNFMVHDPVPDNHRFAYCEIRPDATTDFRDRCDLYRDFARPYRGHAEFSGGASQLLAITHSDPGRFQTVRSRLPAFSVIRTTSPLDHRSMWIELFPREVNKARASQLLAEELGIPRECTYALGNDYNDIDLLEWAARSLVTANAADDLRQRFAAVTSNDDHAFAEAVAVWLDGQPK